MLRGPVQASLPSLQPFPHEAGVSGHVYPLKARSASPLMPQHDFRLPANIATATFWRSPYSEALRQSRPSARGDRESSSRISCRAPDPEDQDKDGKEDKDCNPVKSILKNGGDIKDSGSDISSDNVRQIRGILCKSSLSTCSRQSAGKVQKRVKFDASVDRNQTTQSLRQSSFTSCSAAVTSYNHHNQYQHRSKSASSSMKSILRMPSLRHTGERQQSADRSGSQHSVLQHHSPSQPCNPHQHPHIPRPNSGPLIRTSSVPELAMPRTLSRNGPQLSYQVMHSPHSVLSNTSTGPGSTTSCLSPTPIDFKVNRQRPQVMSGACLEVKDPALPQTPIPGKVRFLVARSSYSSGTRSLIRLSRSFTSPSFSLQRPGKHSVPPPSSNNDILLTHQTASSDVHSGVPEEDCTAPSGVQERQEVGQGKEKSAERKESFLDDDKTVQILHWLKEVDHRQTRVGRCPVFMSDSCRET